MFASEPEELAGGFEFTEGPAWHPEGFLVFSDIPADTIYCLKAGGARVLRRPSGHANGLAFDPQGRLVACEHGARRVSRTLPGGMLQPVATHYGSGRLNSPNDVAVRSDGDIFFTDPPYGVEDGERELDFQGLYRAGTDGALALLAQDFLKPNGLAFSPDESVLYVADTERHHLRAFEVAGDGTLRNGRVFFAAEPGEELRPDGMKVDEEGNVYIAGMDGVWVVDPSGRRLQALKLPVRPSNLAFGEQGQTLFITARASVFRVRTTVSGATWPARRGRRRPSDAD